MKLMLCLLGFILAPGVGAYFGAALMGFAGAPKLDAAAVGVMFALTVTAIIGLYLASAILEAVLKLLRWSPESASPKTRARIEEIQSAYADLSPEAKMKLNKLREEAVRATVRAGASHLQRKGHPNAANFARKFAKF
jgi:hypothetical protein